MDVIEAIKARKSIRNFKADQVPQWVLRDVLEAAVRAPSSVNCQPWEFCVVTGEALQKIKQGNLEKMAAGAGADRDVKHKALEGIYRQRQVDLAVQLFGLMGIAREDRPKRTAWIQKGLRFFDAPAAIFVCTDAAMDERGPEFDIGSVTQTICLAALKYGLGTCIQGQGINYPDVVRRHTGLPESKRLMIAIAIGYPDWDFPANKLISEREPLDKITTWHGFNPK